MFDLNIQHILNIVKGKFYNYTINPNILIKKIATNHNDVEKHNIFIAIKGNKFDGHAYVNKAIENGAEFVIVEKQIPNIPQLVVPDCRQALLDIASLNRNNFKHPLIAVTGSAGKTTTKDMISAILSTSENLLKTEANLNNEIGVAKTLLNLNFQHTAAVIEMGMSHKGEISALSKAAKPNIAVLTNIGTAHFENFNSINDILHAKLEILDGMNSTDTVIFNMDDNNLKNVNFQNHKTISCSITNHNADVYATDIKQKSNKICFNAHFNDESIDITLPLFGTHNIINALISIAVASIFKIPSENIKNALESFKTTGLRQKILSFKSIKIIADCYNASPEAMNIALNSLANMSTKGKKIAVLGDMLELGSIAQSTHENIGKILNSLAIDLVLCTGSLSKYIVSSTSKPAYHFDNIDKLVDFLKNNIAPFDIILFKASHALNFNDIITKTFGNII